MSRCLYLAESSASRPTTRIAKPTGVLRTGRASFHFAEYLSQSIGISEVQYADNPLTRLRGDLGLWLLRHRSSIRPHRGQSLRSTTVVSRAARSLPLTARQGNSSTS